MRSRYSAFCTKNIDYLVNTGHPSRRKPGGREQLQQTCLSTQWLGLKVVSVQADPENPEAGTVEFAAFYRAGTGGGQLHERSRFVREAGRWYYLDGEILPELTFKRNGPCWCGSNKKYKRCHGR